MFRFTTTTPKKGLRKGEERQKRDIICQNAKWKEKEETANRTGGSQKDANIQGGIFK